MKATRRVVMEKMMESEGRDGKKEKKGMGLARGDRNGTRRPAVAVDRDVSGVFNHFESETPMKLRAGRGMW
jgi:hypothetical protein